jgi:hypothetical protein
VRREFLRCKGGESEIADFSAGLGVFEELQGRAFLELGEIIPAPVIEVRPGIGLYVSWPRLVSEGRAAAFCSSAPQVSAKRS